PVQAVEAGVLGGRQPGGVPLLEGVERPLDLVLEHVAQGGDLDVLVGVEDVADGPGPAAAATDDADLDVAGALGEQVAGEGQGAGGDGPGGQEVAAVD